MSEVFTCILWAVIIFLILNLLTNNEIEGFGVDEKPFEPDNSAVLQNPWDNIDYIVPRFVI